MRMKIVSEPEGIFHMSSSVRVRGNYTVRKMGWVGLVWVGNGNANANGNCKVKYIGT